MANMDPRDPVGISPDDRCGVCDETRENHGDKNHEFNLEGILIEKKAPQPPRAMAPAVRGLSSDPVTRLVLRLVERLVAQGILKGDDMLYIFGGDDASSNTTPTEGTGTTNPPSSSV